MLELRRSARRGRAAAVRRSRRLRRRIVVRTQATDVGETPVAGSAFQVVVEHRYGETTVPAEPQRVVSVGLTEQDTLLQLGVVPWRSPSGTATSRSPPGRGRRSCSGTPSRRCSARRRVRAREDRGARARPHRGHQLRDEPQGLRAVLGHRADITSVEGASLYFSSWQDQTMQIARALGQETEGQAIVDELAGRYAEVAAAHPEWADLTATFSQGGPYDGQLYVYPAGLEDRVPHRPRLHDDRRPGGVRPRGRHPGA